MILKIRFSESWMDHSLSILSDSHNDLAALFHLEASGRRLLVSITSLAIGASPAIASDHHMDACAYPKYIAQFPTKLCMGPSVWSEPRAQDHTPSNRPRKQGFCCLILIFWIGSLGITIQDLEKCGAVLQRFRTCTNGRTPPAENAYY